MKKIAVILFFVLGLGIISCEKCEHVEPYFQIVSLSPNNLEFTNEGLNPWVSLTVNDTIQWETYFNRVGFNCNYLASSKPCCWSNSLYALSCPWPGENGSKVGVENVQIVTLFDFDSQYLENDTIDSIVELNDWTFSISDFSEFMTIDDYVAENQSSISDQHFEFKLLSPPMDSLQSVQFKIIYELENEEKFEAITEQIVLKQ